jgi:hypothetical protein
MMNRKETLLNWLNREKTRDKNEVELSKNKLISEIKKMKKEDLFSQEVEKPKYSLWQKIKILLWGN